MRELKCTRKHDRSLYFIIWHMLACMDIYEIYISMLFMDIRNIYSLRN